MRNEYKPGKLGDTEIFSAESKLPPAGRYVFLYTGSSFCVGFLDSVGIWRRPSSDQPVANVTGWSFQVPPKSN